MTSSISKTSIFFVHVSFFYWTPFSYNHAQGRFSSIPPTRTLSIQNSPTKNTRHFCSVKTDRLSEVSDSEDMVDNARKKESHWWWFEGHKNTKRSSWLQSTIEGAAFSSLHIELDAKTKAMLRIIEEDADSFAKRAEMFYNKKPELINMVEDFYRAHRSLAERYDLAKAEPVTCTMPSPRAYSKSKSEKELVTNAVVDHPCDTYSISSISEDYNESEIDETEPETCATRADKQLDFNPTAIMQIAELEKLKSEIEMLKEENKSYKIELLQKDEDKREVIRQLSMAINMLKEENTILRQTMISSKDPRLSRS